MVPHAAARGLPAALTPNAQAGADSSRVATLLGLQACLAGLGKLQLLASAIASFIDTGAERCLWHCGPSPSPLVDVRGLKRENNAACSKLNCPVLDTPSFSRHLSDAGERSAGKRQVEGKDPKHEDQNQEAGKHHGQGKDREQSLKQGSLRH